MGKLVSLRQAIRLKDDCQLAVVGSGGKTTALFSIARDFSGVVLVSCSTHLSTDQASLADRHFIVRSVDDLSKILLNIGQGVILFTGAPVAEQRLAGLPEDIFFQLHRYAKEQHVPLLIEADGSRGLPLKAPAEHEPAISAWADHVAVLCGMQGLYQPLESQHVHRPERFSLLCGLPAGAEITPAAVACVATHPSGGLKRIPPLARRSLILNQADTEILQSAAKEIAQDVVRQYHEVVIATLNQPQKPVQAVFSKTAGIILAAGSSSRMGTINKLLLNWDGEPFIRKIVRTALLSGLDPVIIVTGWQAEAVQAAAGDLKFRIVNNEQWQAGQSTSVRKGIEAVPANCGAAIFLLGDQPQVTPTVLTALTEQHYLSQSAIIAPLVDGMRANPVLFDRETFHDLTQLRGDVGGRAIFSKYPVDWLPWHDVLLLRDVDTAEQYAQLLQLQNNLSGDTDEH